MPYFDLFGLQPVWNFVYSIITNPVVTFSALVITMLALYYEYTEFHLAKERWEIALNKMGTYVTKTQNLMDLVFTPEGRAKIEAMAQAVQAFNPSTVSVTAKPGETVTAATETRP